MNNRQIVYNNIKFNHKDKVYYIFKNRQGVGSLYIDDKTATSAEKGHRFYLCTNEHTLCGNEAPDKLGYNYSWVLYVKNNEIQYKEDKNLVLIKYDDISINNINVSSEITEFLYSRGYHNYIPLLYLKLDSISKYNKITELSDNESDIKNGLVTLSYDKIYKGETKQINVNIKFGRLLKSLALEYNKIFNDKLDVSDSVFEKIHNDFSSLSKIITLTVLKGKDILYTAYNSNNHHTGGYLKSCMNNIYSDLKMYEDNPEQINVATFYKDGMICGRTLLWKCIDGVWRYDRIYSSFEYIREKIKNILHKNGFTESVYGSNIAYTVKLDSIGYTRYPYLDSMKFIDKKNSLISNKSIG